MARETGGLRYTIEVRDQFSRRLRQFRSEVAAARREIQGLQSAQTQLNRTRRQTSTAQAQADRSQVQRLREIQAGVRQQQSIERQRAQILRQQRAEASRAARQDIELFRRQAQERARAQQQQAAALGRQARAQARVNRQTQRGRTAFRQLRRGALGAEGAINRVSFSFRRLIGILAVFQAARAGAAGFAALIRGGVQFNQTLEDSQISLAALFSSIGRVRDLQTGELLEGSEAFAAAQGEAARQTENIRAAAVSTTATFEELLRAFQAGVGPGLEAGLSLDEIREVTQRVSQAAAALALPQNQLIEEIRSLLRGTIQARTTIVASVLGISNEDIRQARQAGELFEFLKGELDAFRFAAQATQQSFTGLAARLRDSLGIIAGTAAAGFFDEIKVSLGELSEQFITLETNAEGVVTRVLPNERAVTALTGLFDSLTGALRRFREGISQLSVGEIGNLLGTIGAVIEGLSTVLVGFTQGFIESVSVMVSAVNAIAQQLGGADGILPLVEQIFRFLGLWGGPILIAAGALVSMQATLFLLTPVITVIRSGFRAMLTVVGGLATLVGRLPAAVIPVAAGIALAAVGAEKFAEELLGAKGSLQDIPELLGTALEEFFTQTRARARATEIIDLERELEKIRRLQQDAEDLADRGSFLDIFRSDEEAQAAVREREKAALEEQQRLREKEQDLILRINELKGEGAQIEEDAKKTAEDRFKALQDEVNARENDPFVEQLQRALEAVTGVDFSQLADDFAEGLIDPERVAEKLREALVAIESEGAGGALDPLSKQLRTFLEGIVTNFENGMAIIRGLVSQTAGFISNTIVDALDPTTDTDLRERFARFLQDIARLIIQTLVEVAIAKAILGLASNSGGDLDAALFEGSGDRFFGPGGAAGFAEGGEIPDREAPKRIRPKGLDPRDTTPIWAQPGEFMMKLKAVQRYGTDVMAAINRGLIDPSALRSLVGGRSSRRHLAGIASRGPRGYAEGGSVRQVGREVAAASASAGSSSGSSTPTPAYIVANDQTLDRLLNGGRSAFRRFLADNAQDFDATLRQGRR